MTFANANSQRFSLPTIIEHIEAINSHSIRIESYYCIKQPATNRSILEVKQKENLLLVPLNPRLHPVRLRTSEDTSTECANNH